jgi:UDP-2-acetamido-2,6-beta-L-arabino-hexul-4-ose reductase
MKVLVTGSNGFIGRNLCQHLKEMKDVEVLPFDKDDNFSIIEKNIKNIDFIFHLAGINRPEKVDEFYSGNRDLTKTIIDLLKENKLRTPLLISSSIQAVKDNDYGKSKKEAEDIVFNYDKDNTYVFRLHNVFGKWCRPNYNSVVATFCYNTAHNIDLTVNDPNAEVELIYIDDIIKEFINILNGNKPSHIEDSYCYIEPRYKVTIGELLDKIKACKSSMESILVLQTGNDFTKKLFST